MVKVDIITIFPRMVEAGLAEGVVGRARTSGLIDIMVHNLRDYTTDKHHVVDDVPFGGGPGMVMKPEPFFAALAAIRATRGTPDSVVMLSPAGVPFTQAGARRLVGLSHLVLLCGRYEGIDERVRSQVVSDEISLGDYVISGGELAALIIVDAVTRLLPGALGYEFGAHQDSHSPGLDGLLEGPQYTRPPVFRGEGIPPVLLSGHHAQINRWRRNQALLRTLERRPELLRGMPLSKLDRRFLLEQGWSESDQG
jgi:tRNA (guanine37-N1)-methyltransferase